LGEFVRIAGGEDEFGSGATVTLRQREAEASGGSGDEDDLAGATLCGAGQESVGGCRGDEAGGYLCGVEGGLGLLHAVPSDAEIRGELLLDKCSVRLDSAS
jgi:hypothetical protein